jgi:ligand-binding sensor domain-containing protein
MGASLKPILASGIRTTATILAVAMLLAGSVTGEPSPPIRFSHLSIGQGLSQVSVTCILQDRRGFMWFGTWDGLNRFDGYTFTVYRHESQRPESLSGSQIQSLCEDSQGRLWIGTNNGLNRFDWNTGTFIRYRVDADRPPDRGPESVPALHVDRAGRLWAATNRGLFRYRPEREDFVRHEVPGGGFSVGQAGGIGSIYEDRTGQLWFSLAGSGLQRLEPGTGRIVSYQQEPSDPDSLSDNRVTSVSEDRAGNLWVGTLGGGLNRLESDRFIHYRHDPGNPSSLASDQVRSVVAAPDGSLWVGTEDAGIDRLAEGGDVFEHLRHQPLDPVSLGDDTVQDLYLDRSGAVWVGTLGDGISQYDPHRYKFDRFSWKPRGPNGRQHNFVMSILPDRSGRIWIGTWGGGLNCLDRRTGDWTRFDHDLQDPGSLGHNVVLALCEDRAGRIWVGTNGGLDRIEPDRRGFVHVPSGAEKGGSWRGQRVLAIVEGREDTLWVGTDGGLNRYDPGSDRWTWYGHEESDPASLSHNTVWAVMEDRQGRIWAGTNRGLNRLDPGRQGWIHFGHDSKNPRSLSEDIIRCIHEDRHGTIWVSTYGGGLNRWNADSEDFDHFGRPEGLSSEVIYGILEDSRGRLWFSSNGGLTRFDPYHPAKPMFRNYDARDGLQSNEFNTGAYAMSPEGEMFFGGVNGLNSFFPDRILDNPYPPPVVITSFRTSDPRFRLDQPVIETAEIRLGAGRNSFSVEFAALSFANPSKNRYAYRLEGYESDWVESQERRFAGYTNLDPGTYTFRVRAANNDGLWNQTGASLRVVIAPPFWRTWWFRLLLALTLLAVVLSAHRLRVRSVNIQKRKLVREVEQRTGELQDLLAERDTLVQELTLALDKVRTLKGLLPMCSHCKKIRDDQGYWQQVEVYIEDHTEAEFTHGLCPDCIRKLYPEAYEKLHKPPSD